MIKVCVFDFDGTLVDSMGGFADIAADLLLKYYGIPFAHGRNLYLETSGIPFHDQVEIICPNGLLNSCCVEQFESRKLEGFFRSEVTKNTREGLRKLRAAGLKSIVSSNNFQQLVDEFIACHYLPIDLALGYKQGKSEKGKPHFECIQKKFGVVPQEMVFCGDSIKDGERAQSCDVTFYAKTGTFTREQFSAYFPNVETVDSILELADELIYHNQTKITHF